MSVGGGGGGDRIRIVGLEAHGYHGVLAEERLAGQRFVVDLDLRLDLGPAGTSDDLSRTVDYGQLTRRVHDAVAFDPVNLIETLAQRIADLCLDQAGVHTVTVTVHKPEAPVPVRVSDIAVTLERSRP